MKKVVINYPPITYEPPKIKTVELNGIVYDCAGATILNNPVKIKLNPFTE